MQDLWSAHFTATAQAYWTEARTRALVGERRPAILPGEAPMLFRALGLLHRDGSMPVEHIRKYRQINHMVAVLQPTLRVIRDRYPTVRILDAACGRSYLSTLLAWHFRHNWSHPVQILGVDRNEALVLESQRRAEMIGLDDVLRFEVASLDALDVGQAWDKAFGPGADGNGRERGAFDGLISLHGCDTATDDAIALGLSHRADMIAVVPCCQAELSARWSELATRGVAGGFSALWGEPHLRRAAAAHITDLMRLELLRGAGYDASAIEFVPSEHTPKNTLLRGLRVSAGDLEAIGRYQALKAATGGEGIALERRMPGQSQT